MPQPAAVAIGNVQPCISRNGIACTTIRYCPEGVAWVTALVEGVARRSGLDPSTDVASACPALDPTTDPLDALQSDYATLYNYTQDFQNTTQNALFFPSGARARGWVPVCERACCLFARVPCTAVAC